MKLIMQTRSKLVLRAVQVIVCLWVSGWCEAADDPSLTPAAALERIAQSMKWVNNSVVTADTETIRTTPGEPGITAPRVQKSKMTRYVAADGRMRVSCKMLETGKQTEMLLTDEYRAYWSGGPLGMYAKSPTLRAVWADTDRAKADNGWFLDGIVDLFEAKATNIGTLGADWRLAWQGEELIDGVPCRIIRASSDAGELTVWVDPANDYLPAKYSFANSTDRRAKQGAFELTVDQLRPGVLDGRRVVVSGRYQDHWAKEAKNATTVMTMTRTKIDFTPDFQALRAFDPTCIPDGTKFEVCVDQKAGEKPSNRLHAWQSGRLDADYDPGLVDRIRKQVQPATKP